MSIEGDLLHRHLRGYKDDRSAQVRERMALRLAALLAVFLQNHARCVGSFDSVVLVPSPTRTAVEAIIRRLPSLHGQYRQALQVSGLGAKNNLRADRFTLTRDVAGERVLVVDDTFTRGPTVFSAVAALRQAGAVIRGPLVLGRHLRPDWDPSRELLAWLRYRPWVDSRCCRCDGELARPGQML